MEDGSVDVFAFKAGYLEIADVVAYQRRKQAHYQDSHRREASVSAVDLAADYISLGSTSTTQLLIFSIRFHNCSEIIPIYILAAQTFAKKNSDFLKDWGNAVPKFQDVFANLLTALAAQDLEVVHLIGDTPIRADMRNCDSQSGKNRCNYCPGKSLLMRFLRGLWMRIVLRKARVHRVRLHHQRRQGQEALPKGVSSNTVNA